MVKQDRETDNFYGRLERLRTAYADQVHRDAKQGRLQSLPAPLVPNPPAMEESGEPMVHTAALFSPQAAAPLRQSKTSLVAFDSAPFPYEGTVARTDRPFLNIVADGRRGHRTPFNRVYWADETYSDPRVLLHIPRGFDINKPAVMVLFFHGHGATLERDVQQRQLVPRQITESGVNAVLVAPQLAVDARDSSPGKFWEPGGVKRFLSEAATQLARLQGDARTRDAFAKMPVVIIAYSGGYVPAAWAVSSGRLGNKLRGVVLLDALYGEADKFTSWITGQRAGFFVSAYANSTRAKNQSLEKLLTQLNVPVKSELGPQLGHGSVVFLSTNAETEHRDFVTEAWTTHPIKDLLRRVRLADGGS